MAIDDWCEQRDMSEQDIATTMSNDCTNVQWSETTYTEYNEHLAGLGCINPAGYSGHNITAAEMQGCTTGQALVRKGPGYPAPADDFDFEITSGSTLSGLCNYMTSEDRNGLTFAPVRHAGSVIRVDNWGPTLLVRVPGSELENTAVPFHPTCFELFSRISRLRIGFVDVEGVLAWQEQGKAVDIVRAPAVYGGNEQLWTHNNGAEYLAANPVVIPGLSTLLTPALHLDDPFYSTHASAFTHRRSPAPPQTTPDIFCGLPNELSLAIIACLAPQDIANLRLASPSFTHLPTSLWHRLIREKMPWFYEAWDQTPLSPWVAPANEVFAALKQNSGDEIHPRGDETRLWKTPERVYLQTDKTDWYLVYNLLRGSELKGLRTRRRIWEGVEQMVVWMQGRREADE